MTETFCATQQVRVLSRQRLATSRGVLDMWFEHEVKPRLRGRAFEVRFADDAALVFEREEDARRVLAVLAKRFAKYGLRLHPEKTRLVDFRSPPRTGRGSSQGERSFDLLGFTHFWGRSRKGHWVVQRKTATDRFTRALRAVGGWCRAHRHRPVPVQCLALSRKLQGHYAYYGITGNARALACFLYEVRRLWCKWLNRRSWHARMTWDKFARLTERYPLPHRVWFTAFFVAQRRHSPRSRMPESGTSGSVGAAGWLLPAAT